MPHLSLVVVIVAYRQLPNRELQQIRWNVYFLPLHLWCLRGEVWTAVHSAGVFGSFRGVCSPHCLSGVGGGYCLGVGPRLVDKPWREVGNVHKGREGYLALFWSARRVCLSLFGGAETWGRWVLRGMHLCVPYRSLSCVHISGTVQRRLMYCRDGDDYEHTARKFFPLGITYFAHMHFSVLIWDLLLIFFSFKALNAR